MKTSIEMGNAGIQNAAKLLLSGEVVAFPTETVYGLGANIGNPLAIQKIFTVKGRPSDNPLIVHIAEFSQLSLLTPRISPRVKLLAKLFWPGPLTLVVSKRKEISSLLSAGLQTVAVRMPSHPLARKLLYACNVPLAAPSANSFGKPSPTTASHVYEDLHGKIPLILDGGPCKFGIESTILDMTTSPPTLLRPGGVSLEQLEKHLGRVTLHPVVKDPKVKQVFAKAPGMKYRHYAPRANVNVLLTRKELETVAVAEGKNKTTHFLVLKKPLTGVVNQTVYTCASHLAHDLFAAFRRLDAKNTTQIIVQAPSESHVGRGVRNRLLKAATHINDKN
ncbi:MAG: threonylcarbamoyl-AMP synthase [Candidatus Woesearchaeota archaeon]|nr:MAG: threonylcarbamoyl-AMP synthase [Candidatus Woesearchaeota archaeon]